MDYGYSHRIIYVDSFITFYMSLHFPDLLNLKVELTDRGARYQFGSLIFYWHKRIDATGVWQNKINNYFNYTLNIFLSLILLHGLARFIILLWQFNWQFSLEFLFSSELFVFWVAC